MQDSRGMQDTEANMNRTTIEGVSMAAMDTGPKSKRFAPKSRHVLKFLLFFSSDCNVRGVSTQKKKIIMYLYIYKNG